MRKQKSNDNEPDLKESKPTDLAEGERDTVDESIRIHEKKGDLPPRNPPVPKQKKR